MKSSCVCKGTPKADFTVSEAGIVELQFLNCLAFVNFSLASLVKRISTIHLHLQIMLEPVLKSQEWKTVFTGDIWMHL